MFFYATFITPAMIMRLTDIGSQYVGAFMDSNGEYFDGGKTYKITLPPERKILKKQSCQPLRLTRFPPWRPRAECAKHCRAAPLEGATQK